MRATHLRTAAALLLATTLFVVGCTPTTEDSETAVEVKEGPEVRVASLLDSEGVVLGSMVIQMLEVNGIQTVDRTKFGTPDVVRKALLAGDIDASIDYTGSGQFYVGPDDIDLWRDAERGYEQIRAEDAKNGLLWLTPSPANNGEAFAVTDEFAEENSLETMEDLAAYVNSGGTIVLVGDQAWMDSPTGMKAFEDAYGFTLAEDQKIGLSNGVTAQFIEAVVNGTDGANVAEVYATDGGLAEQGLVVLADSKNVPPVYAPTPIFREEIIAAYPEIEEILAPVFESLTMEVLQDLNRQVSFGGRSGSDVAREYLTENGFLE